MRLQASPINYQVIGWVFKTLQAKSWIREMMVIDVAVHSRRAALGFGLRHVTLQPQTTAPEGLLYRTPRPQRNAVAPRFVQLTHFSLPDNHDIHQKPSLVVVVTRRALVSFITYHRFPVREGSISPSLVQGKGPKLKRGCKKKKRHMIEP
jgi:hypothetical protein